MAEGLESLPPWLQALATIVTAVGVGGAGLWTYVRKKPADAPTGVMTPPYANASNDTAKILESQQRHESFNEQIVDRLERVEDCQKEILGLSHAGDKRFETVLGKLDRLLDRRSP